MRSGSAARIAPAGVTAASCAPFSAACRLSPRNPDAPRVAVGDMGLRHGGEIDGHSTHENGRQIDLYFPRRDRELREPHTIAQVDMRLSRELVRAMLDAGADQVLIGPHIRIGTSAARDPLAPPRRPPARDVLSRREHSGFGLLIGFARREVAPRDEGAERGHDCDDDRRP